MFCENCGHEINDDSSFCENCGSVIGDEANVSEEINDNGASQNTSDDTIVEEKDAREVELNIENEKTDSTVDEPKVDGPIVGEPKAVEVETKEQNNQVKEKRDYKEKIVKDGEVSSDIKDKEKINNSIKKQRGLVFYFIRTFFIGLIPGLICCYLIWERFLIHRVAESMGITYGNIATLYIPALVMWFILALVIGVVIFTIKKRV